MSAIRLEISKFPLWKLLLGGAASAVVVTAIAGPAQLPLLTRDGNAGKPNVVFTIDDSGSMDWQFMPDSMWGGIPANVYRMGFDPAEINAWPFQRNRFVATEANDIASARFRSAGVNRVYYDPNIQYVPWANSDGSLMPQSNPTAALVEPMMPWRGSANLTGASNRWANRWCTFNNCSSRTLNYAPATYYDYDGGNAWNINSFTRVRINDSTAFNRPVSRSDCAPDLLDATNMICSQAQEYQNFANWFTYYRRRMSVAIGASSRAFAAQGDGLRVGYGRINKGSSTIDSVATRSVERGVRTFSGADRTSYFTWLHNRFGNGSTPLRYAADGVGQYFRRADNRGPWGNTPGTNDGTPHLECRKSYHILMSDGYWNNTAASTWAARQNVDNQAGPQINGPGAQTFTYQPVPPFQDNQSSTLADVAMYYWSRDLRTDLDNRVRPDADNPAFWQNLVHFTVGLGVGGNLNPDTDLPGLSSGALNWTSVNTNPGKIDDMWHAAVNSRGQFLSAANPDQFATALGAILQSISERETAEGGSAVSSITLETTSAKYIPTYKTGSWSGDIQAKTLDGNGVAVSDLWVASDVMPEPANRSIYIGQGGDLTPVEFNWADMTPAQKGDVNALMDADMVDYIRGDRTNEGTLFRTRDPDSVMGDMVNSLPTLIGGLTDEQYNFLPQTVAGRDSYRAFVDYKKSRPAMLFVGANNGMLHGFRASDGVETFAFIPNYVLPKLHLPTQSGYAHQFMVDGPMTEADAFINGGWKNYLLSSLGGGGRSIFAIDTTDTTNIGANSVKWEFSHPDLGYVMSPVSVGVMKSGKWVAIFGNGYDSGITPALSQAYLFVVDLQTGALIKKIPTLSGGNNGLGGVRLVKNIDNQVVAAYAGDRKGNMWRFNLDAVAWGDWKVGFGGAPLYVTDGGPNQGIQGQPEYVDHPQGGQLVVFGTGRLYEESDLLITDTQAVYGVWDRVPGDQPGVAGNEVPASASLVQQQFTGVITDAGTDFFSSTSHPIDWSVKRGWKLNLSLDAGQRSIYPPQLVRGFVLFNTVAPGASTGLACDDSKSTGYNLLLNVLTGGAPTTPILDTNGDGTIDESDSTVSGYATAADGIDRIMLGTGGTVSLQRAFGQTTARINGRAFERSWRQLLNPPAP